MEEGPIFPLLELRCTSSALRHQCFWLRAFGLKLLLTPSATLVFRPSDLPLASLVLQFADGSSWDSLTSKSCKPILPINLYIARKLICPYIYTYSYLALSIYLSIYLLLVLFLSGTLTNAQSEPKIIALKRVRFLSPGELWHLETLLLTQLWGCCWNLMCRAQVCVFTEQPPSRARDYLFQSVNNAKFEIWPKELKGREVKKVRESYL